MMGVSTKPPFKICALGAASTNVCPKFITLALNGVPMACHGPVKSGWTYGLQKLFKYPRAPSGAILPPPPHPATTQMTNTQRNNNKHRQKMFVRNHL